MANMPKNIKRQTYFDYGKYRQSIYQGGDAQDKMTLKSVADNFTKNIGYQDRMKQRDIEEDF